MRRVVGGGLILLGLLATASAWAAPRVAVRAHNVDILVSDTISAHLIDLTAELVPRPGHRRVDLEDGGSFTIRVTAGCARLSAAQLTRLFNDRILDYEPRALNDVHFMPEDGAMQVTGGVRLWHRVPPFWLAFSATTDARVDEDGLIRLAVRDEHLLGLPVGGLLDLAHTPLDRLLTVEAPGTRVVDNTVLIDTRAVLPGPAIDSRPVSAHLSAAGLTVCFEGDPTTSTPALPADLDAPASYLWVQGPRLAALGQEIAPARLLVAPGIATGAEPSEPMLFRLVKSRDQIAAGHIELGIEGRMIIRPGPAQPGTPAPDR